MWKVAHVLERLQRLGCAGAKTPIAADLLNDQVLPFVESPLTCSPTSETRRGVFQGVRGALRVAGLFRFSSSCGPRCATRTRDRRVRRQVHCGE